jgi:tetratricopeptide (TPR) repeat protein
MPPPKTPQGQNPTRGAKKAAPPKAAPKNDSARDAEAAAALARVTWRSEGWPEWKFPRYWLTFELTIYSNERIARDLGPRAAIFAWDGTRALALLSLGRERPEPWAALSRAARSYLEFALSLKGAAKKARTNCLNYAASLAAGALYGFDLAARAEPPGPRVPDEELSFARETIEIALREGPRHSRNRLRFPPALAFSLADAWLLEKYAAATRARAATPFFFILEKRFFQEEDPFPSAEELRDALAKAEAPQGRKRASKEALDIRSRLGLELWDSGDKDRAAEATEALREAAEGLERLLGPTAPESLSAKERLARRLAGLGGFGRIPPLFPPLVSPAEKALGLKLAGELQEMRPLDDETEAFLASVKKGGATELAVTRELLGKGPPETSAIGGEGDLAARALHDLALAAASSGDAPLAARASAISLSRRWVFYGGRHPETASSLALMGDLLEEREFAPAYWTLALEAIGGLRPRGSRYVIMAAELTRRIGVAFMEMGDYLQAAAIFREADDLYRRRRPDADPERLELAALIAYCRFHGEDPEGAREKYRELENTLSKAPTRRAPDPRLSSDGSLLALCQAMIGATTIFLNEDPEATDLLKRAREIWIARPRSEKAWREARALLSSPNAPKPIRLMAQATRFRRGDGAESLARRHMDKLFAHFNMEAKSFSD